MTPSPTPTVPNSPFGGKPAQGADAGLKLRKFYVRVQLTPKGTVDAQDEQIGDQDNMTHYQGLDGVWLHPIEAFAGYLTRVFLEVAEGTADNPPPEAPDTLFTSTLPFDTKEEAWAGWADEVDCSGVSGHAGEVSGASGVSGFISGTASNVLTTHGVLLGCDHTDCAHYFSKCLLPKRTLLAGSYTGDVICYYPDTPGGDPDTGEGCAGAYYRTRLGYRDPS